MSTPPISQSSQSTSSWIEIYNPAPFLFHMCVLSDNEILRRMKDGSLVIEDFSDRGLTPNGYDLRIAELSVRGGESFTDGIAKIPPRTMFYVSTKETVSFPSDVCAQLWLRTTWIRKGIMSSFGKIDAGFQGTLTLGAYNATDETIEIPIGDRFCQMVMEYLHTPAQKDYSSRSGNYQGQKGITLEPRKS